MERKSELPPFTVIFNEKQVEMISPKELDLHLAKGWRHFGKHFYRYSVSIQNDKFCEVWPLRIDLAQFTFRKSQLKISRKANQRFVTTIQEASITPEKECLFEVHKTRFKSSIPESLYDFLSANPAIYPTQAKEVTVYDEGQLIACSFFDVGQESLSSIYAMFDPAFHLYSLGTFTLLEEINYAISQGKKYLYLGYCYNTPSFYDYKKEYNATQKFDWKLNWEPLPR